MRIEKKEEEVQVILDLREIRLLRRVVERASIVDVPPSEQAEIATFCDRLLPRLSEWRRTGR